ncbi:MAG: MTH938/NDUFAF3 family protein [Desulfobacteraceae bacterium]|nr:MTH938/NDUFAF3 family protein [Desulfobacteraceae bacterium]
MIEAFSFGNIVVKGITYSNDIKIIQGKVIPTWWRKRGHQVGIDDIQDIIDARPDILVLGKGKPGMMKSTPSLCEFLKQNDIDLIEEKTSKAIKTFNRLFKQGKNVCAGFHLTC